MVLLMTVPAVARATDASQAIGRAVAPMKLTWVKVSEPYAIARVVGAMEGQAERADWLLERFSFGWQRIGYSPDHFPACFARLFGLTEQQIRSLELQSADNRYRYCAGGYPRMVDRGPRSDVEAVRRIMAGQYSGGIPDVHVVRDHALAEWGPPGGGARVFEKKAGRWIVIGGGGGQIDAGAIYSYGVPLSDARELMRH